MRHVPDDIREAVETDAERQGTSRNAVIVGILCEWAGLVYEQPSYRYTEAKGSDQWGLRVPVALRNVIRAHAQSIKGATQPGVVMRVLADHYGLPERSLRKRGARRLDPEEITEARRRHTAGESVRSLAKELGVRRETLNAAIQEEEVRAA